MKVFWYTCNKECMKKYYVYKIMCRINLTYIEENRMFKYVYFAVIDIQFAQKVFL